MKGKKAEKKSKTEPFSIDLTVIEENNKELAYLNLLLKGSNAELYENYKEAITMYDKALEIKPGVNEAFHAMRKIFKTKYEELKPYYEETTLKSTVLELDEIYNNRFDVNLNPFFFNLE